MRYPDYYPNIETAVKYHAGRGVAEEYLAKFYETLIDHITCVQEAGTELGVPIERLRKHDLSKFSLAEFAAYAKHFQGGGAPDEFALAWLHHLHLNDHHWQFWLVPDGYSQPGSQVQAGALKMPEEAALEMLADWIGASKAYTGSEDMSDWLWKNIPRISLHSATAAFVRNTLRDLGYDDVLALNFKSEVLLASHNV